MYEKELQSLGLTLGESKVYSSLIRLESSTVGPIVKESRVAYSNIYEILNKLIQKGLVSYIIKEKIKYYKSLQPLRLKEYIESQKEEIKRKEKELENILPKLKKLSNKNNLGSSEIYIGQKGLLAAYENLLNDSKKNDEMIYFYSYDQETYKSLNDFYYQLFPKIKQKRLKLKCIANNKYKDQFKKEGSPKFLKIKFVDYPTPPNIDIFKDKLLITIWKDTTIGILVTSKEVTDNFREYFNSIWNNH